MKEIIEKYKEIITENKIIVWESEPTSYRLRSIISFIDGSHLTVRDYLFQTGRKYSFHWQDKDDKLIIRWDNALHWEKIDTFPHHKHEEDNVSSSKEVTLDDVLNHIYVGLKK